MKKRRKTVAERRSERAAAERQVWTAFRPKLEALQTMPEAYQLVAESPRPDAPGRRYYSNLGFFLQSFSVPDGSSNEERALYLQFIERLDAAGMLKPGAREKITAEFRHATNAT